MIDVLVSGAGPAGTIAATVLARSGLRVRVLDRARFPRDKLCGDTVNPGALAVLARLGLAHVTAGSLAVRGMVITDGAGVRSIARYPDGVEGRALRRCALDGALVGAARREGVEIDEGVLVLGPEWSHGRVGGLRVRAASGREHCLAARLVIAADGAASRLARELRLSRHPRWPRRWAVGAYFSDVTHDAGISFGEMHIRRNMYIGIAPTPGALTNVCVVTGDRERLRDPGAIVRATLEADPALRDRFGAARMLNRPVALGPLAVDNAGSSAPGVLLAGDAAGFIDPMTGDGLRFAFRGAELAAQAALRMLEHGDGCSTVDRGEPDRRWLHDARRREFGRKWRFNRMLRSLVDSPVAMRAAGAGASLAPALLERLVRFAGDVGRH